MSLVKGFNADEVDPSESYDAIPPGWYKAIIVAGEERDTKAGTGQYLSLEFEVIEGEHRGRKLWTNLNLDNPNPKAVAIARKDLSAICTAVGVPRPQHHADLYDRPLMVKVAVREYQGEQKNEVKGYKATAGDAPRRREDPPPRRREDPPPRQRAEQSEFSDDDGGPPWAR